MEPKRTCIHSCHEYMCVHKYTCVSIVLIQNGTREPWSIFPVLILQSIEPVNLSEIIQAQVPGFCRLGLGFSDGQVAGCHVDDVGTIFLMNSSSDLSSWLRKLFWKGVSEQTSSLTDPCVRYPSVSPEKHTGLVSQPHRYEGALPMFKV